MGFKEQYEKKKAELLNDKTVNAYNKKLFKQFFEWEEEKLKRQNGLTKLDEANYKTLCGYTSKFRNVNNWFKNKAWNKLTAKEIKQVYNDLEDGKIVNRAGKPFGDRRSYYNKIFRAKPFQLAGLRDSVDTALEFFTDKRKPEVEFINEETFKDMISVISKPHHLALFWLAWDVGENITSLLKLKRKHFKRQINKDTKEAEYLVYLPQGILKRSRQTRSEPTIFPETVRALDIIFKKGKEVEYRDEKGLFRRKYEPYEEEDNVFRFGYRQALYLFTSVVKKVGAKCEPTGNPPSWTHMRKGMACNLHLKGWSVEDINLRLGHSPTSRWFDSYVNYLAVNRKRVIKSHYIGNLEEVKNELEESKQREKLSNQRLERLKEDIEQIKKLMIVNALGKANVGEEEENKIKLAVDGFLKNG